MTYSTADQHQPESMRCHQNAWAPTFVPFVRDNNDLVCAHTHCPQFNASQVSIADYCETMNSKGQKEFYWATSCAHHQPSYSYYCSCSQWATKIGIFAWRFKAMSGTFPDLIISSRIIGSILPRFEIRTPSTSTKRKRDKRLSGQKSRLIYFVKTTSTTC